MPDHPESTMIALPRCDCGTQMFVKAVFTDEELAAPNMTIPEYEENTERIIDRDTEMLRRALAGYGIEIPQRFNLVKQWRVSGSHRHPMPARHQELARQLIAAGKTRPIAEQDETGQDS